MAPKIGVVLVDYLLKTKDSRPPSSGYYIGNYWGIKQNKLTNISFSSNSSVKWENVPIGSYYKTNAPLLVNTFILIGEYCLKCNSIDLYLPQDRFYIKGSINSNDFTTMPLDASNLLRGTLKRNPRYVCVSDVSQTSFKNHLNKNSTGMFVDFTRPDETRTDLCYYASSAYDPIIPLYPGYEIEPSLYNGTPDVELVITTFKLN